MTTLVFGNIKYKRPGDKHSVAEKLVGALLILFIFTQSLLVIVIPNTNLYEAAKKNIIENKDLNAELGNIEKISIMPAGGFASSSSGSGEAGNAELNLIVKGNKKFKDLKLQVIKSYADSNWTVIYEK